MITKKDKDIMEFLKPNNEKKECFNPLNLISFRQLFYLTHKKYKEIKFEKDLDKTEISKRKSYMKISLLKLAQENNFCSNKEKAVVKTQEEKITTTKIEYYTKIRSGKKGNPLKTGEIKLLEEKSFTISETKKIITNDILTKFGIRDDQIKEIYLKI
jgi:hypothetical protein